jgi:hypothetical protein
MPPAFALSQDQTLRFISIPAPKRRNINERDRNPLNKPVPHKRNRHSSFKHVSIYLKIHQQHPKQCAKQARSKTTPTINIANHRIDHNSQSRHGAPPTYPFHSRCKFQRTTEYCNQQAKNLAPINSSGGAFYSYDQAVSTTIGQPSEDFGNRRPEPGSSAAGTATRAAPTAPFAPRSAEGVPCAPPPPRLLRARWQSPSESSRRVGIRHWAVDLDRPSADVRAAQRSCPASVPASRYPNSNILVSPQNRPSFDDIHEKMTPWLHAHYIRANLLRCVRY